ncbi:MAG TPA: pirin family protein [Myxococcota bacterium]|nr:pirin family protein [Myxococcota bacterium]HRY96239.1 pirin family protein [Myxococcota bacterium]HSA22000.1 pirin family protein [Myxococcota bacterium]
MVAVREVRRVLTARPTREGAGVRLRRVFGEVSAELDPFLLLDDFGSDDPADYLAGFPWHPHRGIETITWMLAGEVAHGDSLGNRGVIGPGEVQWMTAGAGIIHQEMPRAAARLRGFQLWANLPRSHKLMPPRYREVKAGDIPRVRPAAGVEVALVCGRLGGQTGPVTDIVTAPTYLELRLEPGAEVELPLADGHNALVYVHEGGLRPAGGGPQADAGQALVLSARGVFRALAAEAGARCLLASGQPLGEPVAWGGPIVMNTQAELDQAFQEYQAGTFLDRTRRP